MVLCSPSQFHTENLCPRLLRLSPDQSHQNETRERSGKGPVRIVHSHTARELRKVQSWRNVFRTAPSDYGHGMQLGYHTGLYCRGLRVCSSLSRSWRGQVHSWFASVKNSDRVVTSSMHIYCYGKSADRRTAQLTYTGMGKRMFQSLCFTWYGPCQVAWKVTWIAIAAFVGSARVEERYYRGSEVRHKYGFLSESFYSKGISSGSRIGIGVRGWL